MNTSNPTQLVRVLGGLSVAGVVLFVTGIVVAGFAYPGYSHIDQMISELGGVDATHAWIQNASFVLFGVTAIGLAVALALDARRVFTGAALLAVLGFSGTVMEGVVHCDSGCKGETTEGAVHLMFGFAGFVCGVLALFLLLRHFRRDPRWAAHVAFTRGCAWAALAGLVLFVVSNGAPAVDGLAQRLFVLPLLVFVAGTGWRLAAGRVGPRAATMADPTVVRPPSTAPEGQAAR